MNTSTANTNIIWTEIRDGIHDWSVQANAGQFVAKAYQVRDGYFKFDIYSVGEKFRYTLIYTPENGLSTSEDATYTASTLLSQFASTK